MRENLGKELDRAARSSARKDAGRLARLAARTVKDISKYPTSVAGSEETTAPALNAYRSLTRKPLVADTLRLFNRSTGAEYAPGTAFVEDAAGGRFQNLTIAEGTSLDAFYHYYKGGGGGVTDHGALTGLADDDHTQYQLRSEKGQANGYAPLDSGLLIPRQHIPAVAITSRFVVNSEAAQIGLAAQEGDVAIRTDLSRSFIHNGGTAGTMADWDELLTPTDQVSSVDGRTGTVTLTDLYAPASHVGGGGTAQHPLVTSTVAGFMAPADFNKLAKLDKGMRVSAAGVQAAPVNTWTRMDCVATPDFITTGTYDGTLDRWTCDAASVYMIGGNAYATGTVDGINMELALFKNGVIFEYLMGVHSGSTRSLYASGAVPVNAAVGDFFDLRINHYGTGKDLNIGNRGYFYVMS
jgi:hypothetical protein